MSVSVFDELKGKAGQLRDKAAHLVGENSDKLKDGVGKAGDFIDSKTGGKYSGQVDGLQAKAANLIDRADGGNTPGAATDESSPSA
ncbi:antitoxin [Arthrobacter crystallopoietes]|uniref:antitoxin n=1 Tax=Crystallibacter crystallopoietes TaxID=37928 RepID=UPI001F114200|nr:antitoxin [Arthrobacter crystallopoietes]